MKPTAGGQNGVHTVRQGSLSEKLLKCMHALSQMLTFPMTLGDFPINPYDHIFTFSFFLHIYGTAKATRFKFGKQIDGDK